MNKIGRKNTVLLSLLVTVVSLFIPLLGNSFTIMLIAFSLLGIGNAFMQTSINPLAMLIIGDKNLASTLTFGQFVKAIASFLAPYLAMWGATAAMPSFGYDWRVLFIVYFVVGAVYRLLCCRCIKHLITVGDTDTGGNAGGQVVIVHGLHPSVVKAHRAAVVLRHHVSRGYRRRYEYYRSEAVDGACGHVAQ